MLSACCQPPRDPISSSGCPRSGSPGEAVDRRTIKALLTEPALGRLEASGYRFCPDADCDVVYFSAKGSPFVTRDVRVGVWQKLPFGDRPMCYCFGETESTIRAEIEATGRSGAVERIRAHIAADRCACEVRNPRGACCLGDVIASVKRVQRALFAEASPRGGADAC